MQKETIYKILEEAYFSEGCDEEQVLIQLPRLLQGVEHFVDIGASLGQFTLHASKCFQGGRIDSFEADPIRSEKLKENCAIWSRNSGNKITSYNMAVTKESGFVSFHTTQSNVSGGLFKSSLDHLGEQAKAAVDWTQIRVAATSLDEFYKEGAFPQFIKMDIEGAEGDALNGATQILKAKKTIWLIELHNFDGGWPPNQVKDFMWSFGYSALEIAPGRVLFRPISRFQKVIAKLRALRRKVLSIWKS
jgi:FkbM family methyltransferase